jgi:segregation and condensation protein A
MGADTAQKRFTLSVENFSGPLDVLLELVEKRKLFINEVSLASVADAYIEYVRANTIPMYDRASYIAIAATLVLIKSRSLLPDFHLTEEEEIQVEDLTTALERYALYKKAAKGLERVWGINYLAEFRKEPQRAECFAPSSDMTLHNISISIGELMNALPVFAKEHPKAAVYKTVSIEEMIERIKERVLRSSTHTSFRTTAAGSHRNDVVVLFLALLELVKLGMVEAEQQGHADDILMIHSTTA